MSGLSKLVLPLCLIASGAVAELLPVEQACVRSIDAGLSDALELLRRTVDQNSGTMNFDGIRTVGKMFEEEFEARGFTTKWVDGAAWNRAGHVVAERMGSKGAPHVLLIGHIDTVFETDSPFQRYEERVDSTAVGPGIIDMKGGIVVMLLAIDALADVGQIDRISITVVLTGDEENVGRPIALARRDLREAAERADYALGFEDGDGDPKTAVVARRSSSGWVLHTKGRPSHSSQIFREDIGSGAIYEASRILTAFHDTLGGEQYLTFNPGVIVGGTTVTFDREQSSGTAFGKSNVVSDSVVVAGDIRALSLEQLERIQRTMHRIVDDHYPRTRATIVFGDGYPPLAPSEGNMRLLAIFDGASRDLGLGPVAPVDPARAGAADISFVAGLVDGALDGLGLMGTGGHTADETADLRTLASQAKRVAVFLSRVAQ